MSEGAHYDLLDALSTYIARHDLLRGQGPTVVGLSAGVDSMSLLDLLARCGLALHGVHVNYGLRGDESDEDERLVTGVCAARGIALTVHKADDGWRSEAARRSLQEAARDLRYSVMAKVARSVGSSRVTVGHHRDDQAETMLLRLIRGGGPAGVGGMAPMRPLDSSERVFLVRPLLFAARQDIEQYASWRGLAFRRDPSNLDARFDRAKVRQTILPALREAFGDAAVRNLAQSASRLREFFDDAVAPMIEADLEAMTEHCAGGVRLDLRLLNALPQSRRDLVLLSALQRYLPGAPRRSTTVERVADLIHGAPGRHLSFGDAVVWRERDHLVLASPAVPPAGDPSPIHVDKRNETAFGALTVERIHGKVDALPRDRFEEVVDCRALERPLELGPWLPGERFRPLGQSGTKKISDFLNDEKVPTRLKRTIPVLRSGGDVVWIPGFRIAHGYRITSATEDAVRLTFEAT